MKPLIPPKFVNVPSSAAYDADLADSLFRTYARLRGLAWQSNYQETPPLTIEELAAICHHNVRSVWGHLSKLRRKGLVTWHTVGSSRMVLSLVLQNFAVTPLQNFAVPNGGIVVVGPDSKQQQQPKLLQNFAVDERTKAILEALAEYGADDGPAVREVAALEHITPELIHAWGEHLTGLDGVRNLPGLLLYKLRATHRPPHTDERRGGARTATASEVEDHEAQSALLDVLRVKALKKALVAVRIQGKKKEALLNLDDPPYDWDVYGWFYWAYAQGWAQNPAGAAIEQLLDPDVRHNPPEPFQQFGVEQAGGVGVAVRALVEAYRVEHYSVILPRLDYQEHWREYFHCLPHELPLPNDAIGLWDAEWKTLEKIRRNGFDRPASPDACCLCEQAWQAFLSNQTPMRRESWMNTIVRPLGYCENVLVIFVSDLVVRVCIEAAEFEIVIGEDVQFTATELRIE
jgi:hypothetical protein